MKKHLIALCLACALAACDRSGETQHEAPIRVEGERVILSEPEKADFLKLATVERDKGTTLRITGRLIWNEDLTARVVPQVAGRIQKIAVELGASVKAGQLLATLISPEFGIAEADARKAQADLTVARKALERQRELHAAGVVSDKDWQQTEAETTRIQADADRARLRLSGLGGSADGAYPLRSPLPGIVVERNLSPGMEYRPEQNGEALFVVTDPTHLWLRLDAAESDLAALKTGELFAFTVKQYPGEKFTGTLRHIGDFVDPTTRTVPVRGEVNNPDRRLKGGMFATAQIELPPTQLLEVPAAAVILIGNQHYVLVEEAPGRYVRRTVRSGRTQEGRIAVLEGLTEGERVVVEGNLHLIKFFKAPAQDKQ